MATTPPTRRRMVRRPAPASSGASPAPQEAQEAAPHTFEGGEVASFSQRGQQTLLDTILSSSSTPARPPRHGRYLHVSDLISNCIRRIALQERLKIPPPEQSLTLSDIFTFAQGNAIHDATKALFAGAAPEMVWGLWSCKCGFLRHEEPCTLAETDQEELCPHCGGPCNVYGESPVFDEEYLIVGNPDLVLYQPRYEAQYLAEIKSTSEKKFEELSRPEPDHILQIVFYWWLKHRAGVKLMDKVSVFYVTKGWKFGRSKPYKEFVIDPLPMLPRLNDMLDDARARKDAMTSRTARLPVRTKCATEESTHAKSCPTCTACFQTP